MPLIGPLAENGLGAGGGVREGNEAPAARNVAFIQECAAQMPQGNRISQVRADRAAYHAEGFNWCEAHKVTVAIGGVLDTAWQAAIAALPEAQWPPYAEGHLAETVHGRTKTTKAFRLMVLRRPVQQDLFRPDSPSVRSTVIASNREDPAQATGRW